MKSIIVICFVMFSVFTVDGQVTEHFSDETPGATSFYEGGAAFSITGGKLEIYEKVPYGLDDDVFIANSTNKMTQAGVVGSVQCTSSDFNVHSLYLSTWDQSELIYKSNDILILGKLDGSTVFTHTVLYSDINSSSTNNYLTFVDLSSKSSYQIDELEFVVDPFEAYYVSILVIDDFKFSIVSANAAPTATAPSAPSVTEDDTNVALADDIQVADTDGDDQTVTFTITGGTLTTGTTDITFGGDLNGSSSFTAAGTLAAINTSLDAATFTPTPNLSGTNAATISFTTNDGTADSSPASVSFDITAVNDDPSISGLPTDITVSEDIASNVDLSAATLSDVDAGSNSIVLTIEASAGTLTAGSGGSVTIGGSGTATLSLTGSVANIDSYLNTSSNIKYTSASNVNGSDAATLTLTANDGGYTGSVGGENVALGTVNIDITAVNDAPSINTNNGLSLNEGATGTITSASNLSATDVDNDDASLIFTLTTNTSNGAVKKSGTTINLNDAFTQADLIAGNITYIHDGTNTTSDSFIFKVSDGSAELTNQTFSISVTAIDDDTPTISTNNGLTLNEGVTKGITLTELEANDTDTDNVSLTFTITSTPSNGQLEHTDNPGVAILSFTQQQLSDGKIVYIHDGSNTTSDSFTFKVADGTPNELTGQTFSITINDVTSPLLVSASPADDATNATLSGNIVLNFDDDIVAGTGNITIKKLADNSTFEQISIGDAKINISSSQLTINPAGTLGKGEGYYIEIDATALDDDGGNSFAGISGNSSLNFITVNVVINEIVTDPKQDWSSSSFVSAPGGVSGSNDEWVELYINSTGIDLTGWTIELIDGSDIVGDLTNTGAFDVSNYVGSGAFTNTTAGDYLVLGNPVGGGLLNNSITINLKDPGGAIVDAVVLGGGSGEAPDGGSTDIYNESVQRYTNGLDTDFDNTDFTLGQATVGAANSGSSVTLSVSSATIAEASGVSTITATLSAVSSQDVNVTIAVNGSSSASAGDYDLSSTSIIVSAGNVSNTAILTATQDLKDENNETVIIDITGVTGGTEAGVQQVTVTIADDDDAPSVAFNSVSSNGSESVGSTDLQVDLSVASGLIVEVDYVVTGTASGSGTDYTLADGTLTIGSGDVSNNITISSVVDDLLDENNETVIVTLSNPTNATLGTNTVHTYTINDNDAAPSVAFNSISSNGLESVSSTDLQVDLSAASGLTVAVDYAVTGTASGSGTDYTLANGTLTIATGDASNNITIGSIVDDLLDENNETVIVTLSNPTNAALGTNTVHTYTINDNDAAPSVAFNSISSNGLESVSSTDLQVDLSVASGLIVEVDYVVTGTASGSGTDYTLANGTLTIAAGDASNDITIGSIVDDLLDENNETVIVTLSNPTNATLGTNTVHTYTINDNDAAPSVAFNSISSNGLESVSSTDLQVDLSATSGLIVEVDYVVTGTASGSGTDYTLADGTLTIAAGDASNDITIGSIVDDLLDENNETVIVTLSNPTNAALGTNTVHTYTINDNDAAPSVAFNSISSNGLESVSSTDLQVDLSATSGLIVEVDYVVTGTASGSGTDYTLADGTLTIAAGDASNNITIGSIVDDLLDENNETVIVTLSNPTNATLGTNTVHTYTINDNDETPVIASSQSFSVNEDVINAVSVGNVLATDTDLGTIFGNWTIISGNDDAIFAIDPVSGVITVEDNSNLDFETQTSYSLTVTVSDGTNTSVAEIVTVNVNDVNDNLPVVTASQIFNIAEDIANSGTIGTVLATDADAGTSFSAWTETGGTGASIFEINASSGAITVTDNSGIDYETTTSYTYTVTVSDGINTSASETITINITDVNDVTPVITPSQSFSVDEDASNTTSVGTVLATDGDATATTFSSWTITAGNTNSVFAINSSTGEITVNDANDLDYESITSYSLSITVSDGVNTSAAETVTVDVNDINDEIPVFTSASAINIDENTTDVITLTATDGDAGTTFTFNKIGGDDQALFTINSSTGELAFASSPDYETPLDIDADNDYIVQVSVSDGLNSSTQTITVSVDNVTGITITSNGGGATAGISIPENSTSIVAVTSVNEGVAVPSYSLVGGADQAKFNIHPTSGVLTLLSAPDYESAQDTGGNNSYEVIVRVTGDGGATDDQTITVTITDVNDITPVVTASQSFSIAENIANSGAVGTVLATDGDAGTSFSAWTETGGTGASIFEINASSGAITVTDNSGIDYETTTSYTYTVTVSDGINTSAAETITINITDVNDVNPVITASQTFNIDENSANATSVGTVLASDGDVTATTYSGWTITAGNTNAVFAINSSTGELTVNDTNELDYESTTSYNLTVIVSDGVNTSASETVVVNVNALNDNTPVVTVSQSFTIDENLNNDNIFGTIKATDLDSNPEDLKDWTITNGNNNNAFTINSQNGQISINNSLAIDREITDKYLLEITVSDGEFVSKPEVVTVYINDLNDNRPVIEGNQTFSLDENPVKGTTIGNIAVTDADILETIYSNWTIANFVDLDGNGNNAISIHPETGELTVNDPLDFDFEKAQSFSLLIKVSDGTDFGSEEEVFININNLNDNAPAITGNQTFSINENAINITSIGTVLATDSDAGTTLTDWTIISGNEDGIFTITPSTGEITIVDNTNLDFERDEIYDLVITVKDGENTSLEGTVRISVIDINEAPTAIQLSNAAIAENSAVGTEVGTLTASDEDKDPTLSFSMAQNEFFELHGDKIVSKEIFDYEDHISYLIQVNVEDQGGLSHGESFTIQIENKNEAPRFISEPFVDAVLNESYVYMIEYQDVDAEGCVVTAFEKPSWLNFDDNGDGTATLYGLPTEAGTFNVILEAWDNEYLVRQEFKIIVETVTGIEDVLTAPIVHIYPNPVVQELNIDLSDLRNDETTISLFSMTGSLIFKEEHKNIGGKVRIVKSVEQLRSGIYLLLIEWEGYQKSYKIVKE